MNNAEVFRTRSSFFYAGSVQISAGIISLLNIFEASQLAAINTISWAVIASFTAHLIFVRPKIVFYDEGLRITNPFNEILIGWHEVQDIDNRFSLSVMVDNQKIHAWAAPAPSRYGSRGIHPSEIKGLNFENQSSIRAADSPRSLSGAAAILARNRFAAFKESEKFERIQREQTFNSVGVIFLLGMLTLALGLGATQG